MQRGKILEVVFPIIQKTLLHYSDLKAWLVIHMLTMITEKKKVYPILGLFIGLFLIIFGTFGIFIFFWDVLSEQVIMWVVMTIGITGAFFFAINLTRLGNKELAKLIDNAAILMYPKTLIIATGIITKVKGFFIVKFQDYYLNIIRMHETTDYSPSWYRRMVGPKLPTIIPLKCPVITEFQGYKIRKCEGTAHIYDIDEDRWISGHATMFSLYFFFKSRWPLLKPDVFQNLIHTIKQFE